MTKKIMLTIAMCLGIFIVMLDTTIMNITLPAIQKGLGVKLDQLSWTINVYTIIFASCTIPLSKIADIYGKGRLFVLGLLLFGIGSLLSGLANGFSQLILGRIISSFGAAILLPVGNSLGISSWRLKIALKLLLLLVSCRAVLLLSAPLWAVFLLIPFLGTGFSLLICQSS